MNWFISALFIFGTYSNTLLAQTEEAMALERTKKCNAMAKSLNEFSARWKNKKGPGFWADFEKSAMNNYDCDDHYDQITENALYEHWDSIEELANLSPGLREKLINSFNSTWSPGLTACHRAISDCPQSLKAWCAKVVNSCKKLDFDVYKKSK